MARALIIGDSGGIGAAMAQHLRARGDEVVGLSRSGQGFDLEDPAAAEALLAGVDGPFDRVVVATGILAPPGRRPEKALREIEAETMARVLAVNTIGPALVLRHVPRLIARDARAVVAVLTARVGSIGDNGLGGWYSYRASKAAANQLLRTAAIELGRTRKQAILVALHPGTVETEFTAAYPAHDKHSAPVAAAHLVTVMDDLAPDQSGRFFDWRGDPVPW